MTPHHPHFAQLFDLELHRFIGVEFHDASDGRAHLSFLVRDSMLTPGSSLHAGYLYTVCDFAAYVALMGQLAADEGAVTHDLHVSLMRAARPGERVDVCADVVRRGRTIAFLDVQAFCGDRLIASARATKSLVPITSG